MRVKELSRVRLLDFFILFLGGRGRNEGKEVERIGGFGVSRI